ncbi:hypothetical protein CFE70_009365 [Pyrenophora teres f. teres 0-1]
MSDIPIIDFSEFIHGSNEDKQRVARELDDAFHRVGFVYLKNHGVPSNMVDECFTWSKKFFDLPLSTKMLAPHPPGGHHHRGYSAPGVEKVSQHVFDADELSKLRENSLTTKTPDYKESFESGNPTDATQPNIWPPSTSSRASAPFSKPTSKPAPPSCTPSSTPSPYPSLSPPPVSVPHTFNPYSNYVSYITRYHGTG